MRRLASAGLILAGAALLGWAAWSSLRPPPLPYEQTTALAPSGSLTEFAETPVDMAKLERIEVRTPEARNPVATGIATRDVDKRPTPLAWRNSVTEPVFFADIAPAESAKVLAAIREHVPVDAVVLSWWDMSRRIRSIAGRQAPLDDPFARGLLTPTAWSAHAVAIDEKQRAFWGADVPGREAETFSKFINALRMDEAQGAAALEALADGKEALVAVHLSDVWKAAAARPDLISVAYRDFAGGGDMHGVMRAAREWMQENQIEGGFAVEPMGAAVRLHYLTRHKDSERLLARLLPFSTSDPLTLEHLELVYQYKGYWIYKLKPAKG
jgi:hydroxylamine oxidation protein HaoB